MSRSPRLFMLLAFSQNFTSEFRILFGDQDEFHRPGYEKDLFKGQQYGSVRLLQFNCTFNSQPFTQASIIYFTFSN